MIPFRIRPVVVGRRIGQSLILNALKSQNFALQQRVIRHYSKSPVNEPKNESIKNELIKKDMVQTPLKTTPKLSLLQRIKHILKPSKNPFNVDDISALISWLMISNIVLIVLATTTCLSLGIYLINTVFAQELVAKTLGNFITKNSGMRVVFESAIVPDWREGKISFNRCFVSKRPKRKQKIGFEKGNLNEALAENENLQDDFEDDGNYTQFDLTIDQVNVSFSLGKFINGRGIVDEVEINGLRGVVDRAHVHWDPDDDPRNYKNIYKPGDFEIDNFKMSDVLFKLIQPNGFRPFNVSIYNCDLPILRKNWLYLDFLNANSISGSYDDSLFTIHKRHITEYTSTGVPIWKKVTRCRVDSLNVDHLNTGLEGPFGWITSGEVDMIGDIFIPQEAVFNISEIIKTIHNNISPKLELTKEIPKNRKFTLDLQIKLNNVKAAVPLFTNDLSYVNNALIRPIVGYINSRKTYIPIRCSIEKDIMDFDGSWTIYDSLMMDDISIQVYDAFAQYVANEEKRVERLKRVGFWSLQLVFQVLLMSLGMIA